MSGYCLQVKCPKSCCKYLEHLLGLCNYFHKFFYSILVKIATQSLLYSHSINNNNALDIYTVFVLLCIERCNSNVPHSVTLMILLFGNCTSSESRNGEKSRQILFQMVESNVHLYLCLHLPLHQRRED